MQLSALLARSAFALAVMCVAAMATPPAAAQTPAPAYGAPVSMAQAQAAMDAAMAEARANGWSVAIAIVDAGGHLVMFRRMDGVSTVIGEVAIRKAQTSAAAMARSSTVSGWPASLGLLGVRGGVPIEVNGRIVGAIGVSGVASENDERIAAAGAAVVQG